MKVYVKAPSKKSVNESLADGQSIPATEFNMFNPNGQYITSHTLNDLPTGTAVSIYDKVISGSPYAKAYGIWDAEKNKLK
jgi:hypothetical protein